MPATGAGVRHVLLDADGVLQRGVDDPLGLLRGWAGERAEDLGLALWRAEKPALRGEVDFAEVVADLVPQYCDADPAEVYAGLWARVVPDPASLGLVHELRRRGLGVHLGTNQHRDRGLLMRGDLGYDGLFDVSCYSWEVGAAKPDEAFFETALQRIGSPADTVVFVDDLEQNVESARRVGLRAVHWQLDRGHTPLREELLAVGVPLDEPLA